MDNNFQDLILDIEWTKDLGNDLFEEVKKFCKIKSFNEGEIICQSSFIPAEIFYIIEGQARLIYKFENEENTVEKIEKTIDLYKSNTFKPGFFQQMKHIKNKIDNKKKFGNFNLALQAMKFSKEFIK